MAKKKRKKNRTGSAGAGGWKTIVIAAVITFIVGAFIVARYSGDFSGPSKKPAADATREVDLYLSDTQGLMLRAVKRRITKAPLERELEEAVAELVRDPSGTIPAGTRLLGVKVKGQTAFVDFSSEIIKNHTGGSSGETQTIYSIVDTVALNFPKVKEVQILVEGNTEQTLAGHIDISMPLGPDTDIIKN